MLSVYLLVLGYFDEAHNLDFKPRKSLPQFPRTKEQLKRERELIDYKKDLFEQNLKKALTPQEKKMNIKHLLIILRKMLVKD